MDFVDMDDSFWFEKYQRWGLGSGLIFGK